jgi:hypothetical protein
MGSVAYVKIEWLTDGGPPNISKEEQAEILADNVKRLIEAEWNMYGEVVQVSQVTCKKEE